MTLSNTVPAIPPSQRLVPERLSDRLASLLAEQVQSGALAPGDRLPTEPQLAHSHGVSKTVVREAVHQLKSKGLLISRQGSGVYVAPPAANQPLPFDPTVLGSMSAVLQIVEVRRALEGEIALIAAQRATPAHVTQMRRALDTIEQAVAAGGDGVAEDLAFHHCIAQATGNPQFTRLLGFLEQYLREAMRVTRGNEARYRGFRDAVRAEHQAIVNAIEAKDPAAARRAANRHMVQAARRLEAGGLLQAQPLAAEAAPAAAPIHSRQKGNKR